MEFKEHMFSAWEPICSVDTCMNLGVGAFLRFVPQVPRLAHPNPGLVHKSTCFSSAQYHGHPSVSHSDLITHLSFHEVLEDWSGLPPSLPPFLHLSLCCLLPSPSSFPPFLASSLPSILLSSLPPLLPSFLPSFFQPYPWIWQ